MTNSRKSSGSKLKSIINQKADKKSIEANIDTYLKLSLGESDFDGIAEGLFYTFIRTTGSSNGASEYGYLLDELISFLLKPEVSSMFNLQVLQNEARNRAHYPKMLIELRSLFNQLEHKRHSAELDRIFLKSFYASSNPDQVEMMEKRYEKEARVAIEKDKIVDEIWGPDF